MPTTALSMIQQVFSPYELMFMRKPRLPVDLVLGVEPDVKEISYPAFVSNLKDRLRVAYELVIKQSKTRQSQEEQKERYDQRIHGSALCIGDRVLVQNVAFTGKHKLADHWQQDVYIVTDQPNHDTPVYRIKQENCKDKEKVLHRNMLLPIGFIPTDQEIREEAEVSFSNDDTNESDVTDAEACEDDSV